MPRYFFDIGEDRYDKDTEGTDLADDDEARVQAVVFAGDYLRDHPEVVWEGSRFSVTVRGEGDVVLQTIMVTSEEPGEP